MTSHLLPSGCALMVIASSCLAWLGLEFVWFALWGWVGVGISITAPAALVAIYALRAQRFQKEAAEQLREGGVS